MSRCLVELLLDYDTPTAPDSEEAFLAANLCAVSPGIGEDVMERLFRHLLPRITSGFRDTISKAAAAALPIARQLPQLVGPYAKSLLLHEDRWTRCAALALCLESGDAYVDIEDLRSRYPELIPRRKLRSPFGGTVIDLNEDWHCLKSTVILRSTAMLLADGQAPNLPDSIRRVFEEGDLSDATDRRAHKLASRYLEALSW